MTTLTPDTLMKRVSSLVQLGQLAHEALAAVSLTLGRWLAGCPIPLREIERYLPCSPRTTRRIMAQLRSLSLIHTTTSANRCLLALPGCTTQVEPPQRIEPTPQPALTQPAPTPEPTASEPPAVSEPSREPYVPIKPPTLWHHILAPERPHAVRKSLAAALSKALAKHSPDDIDPTIRKKVEAAKYPAAYLATLVTPAGDLKDHVRPGQAKPASTKATKATTTPKPKPVSEPEPQRKEDACPSSPSKIDWAAAQAMFAPIPPTSPFHRR